MKTYITFGQSHAHRYNGKTLDKDCIAVIHHHTDDPNEGRDLAMREFAGRFHNSYTDPKRVEEILHYFPRGLIEVNLAPGPIKMKFNGWDCIVERSHYPHNKQPALILKDAETHEVIAKATSCVDYAFMDDQTAIKDYSENEGMLQSLLAAGAVIDTGIRFDNGFASFPIVEIAKSL